MLPKNCGYCKKEIVDRSIIFFDLCSACNTWKEEKPEFVYKNIKLPIHLDEKLRGKNIEEIVVDLLSRNY